MFRNSQHAADRFGLRDAGNIYGRLTNSTQGVFEDRVAALEGGVAGLAVASGAAAVTYALQNILQNGDHRDLHSFPTRRSSDLYKLPPRNPVMIGIRLFVLIDAAKVRRFFGF